MDSSDSVPQAKGIRVAGTHTLLALTAAWVGRLSVPVILAGTFVNNPWTIVPIYGGSFWFGLVLTRTSLPSFQINWSEITLAALWGVLKPVLWPFFVGTIVAGTLAGLIAYGVVRPMAQTYQEGRASREPSTS
ncbi:MAG: DUF2062 domain-containing protein [Candidatus Tectimicrobiota bacterium]